MSLYKGKAYLFPLLSQFLIIAFGPIRKCFPTENKHQASCHIALTLNYYKCRYELKLLSARDMDFCNGLFCDCVAILLVHSLCHRKQTLPLPCGSFLTFILQVVQERAFSVFLSFPLSKTHFLAQHIPTAFISCSF